MHFGRREGKPYLALTDGGSRTPAPAGGKSDASTIHVP